MAPIAVMGVMAIAPVFGGFAWLSAGVAAWLSGHGFVVPRYRYGIGALTAVAKGQTAGPRPLTLAVAGVLVLLLILLLILLLVLLGRKVRAWSRERARTATARAINARADVDGMRPAERAREAARLHPGLATQLDAAREQAAGDDELQRWLQVVYLLGSVYPQGPAIQPGWEDVELAFMAPRSGKTTALAIPKLLAAPGAAVGTANKPDLYLATCTGRAKRGRVWAFDPQSIAYLEQAFWWDPLRLVDNDTAASRLAAQFTKAISANGGDQFWSQAAEELLTALILAAACTDGRSIRDVWLWLNRPTDPEPVDALAAAGFLQVASGLQGMQTGAPNTRDGIYQTARTGAKCFRSEGILAWVTPPSTPLPELFIGDFVNSTDTVYLMSQDEAGSAAPLLAGFLDQLFDAAKDRAGWNGGRLPIPITAVIDEAANIAPWDRLPDVASYAGSLGWNFLAILQSWSQCVDVWGETGTKKLYGACTVKIIGAGIDEVGFGRDISTLVGQHDVEMASSSYGKGGRSDSYSSQLRDLLPVDELRAMPKGTALVMCTGRRPVMVKMHPWFTAPYGDLVQNAITAGQTAQSARARAHAAARGRQ